MMNNHKAMMTITRNGNEISFDDFVFITFEICNKGAEIIKTYAVKITNRVINSGAPFSTPFLAAAV